MRRTVRQLECTALAAEGSPLLPDGRIDAHVMLNFVRAARALLAIAPKSPLLVHCRYLHSILITELKLLLNNLHGCLSVLNVSVCVEATELAERGCSSCWTD